MSSRDVETLIEKVKTLPSDKIEEVISFVESIELRGEPAKTLWEKIREITSDVPDELWAELPADGSENLDHYLYGAPKK